MRGFFRYVGRNPALGWGLGILALLLLFSYGGRILIDPADAYALATKPDLPPMLDREALAKIGEMTTFEDKLAQLRLGLRHIFGTDTQGKSLLASPSPARSASASAPSSVSSLAIMPAPSLTTLSPRWSTSS